MGDNGRHERLQAERRTCIGLTQDNFSAFFVCVPPSLVDAAFVPGAGDGGMTRPPRLTSTPVWGTQWTPLPRPVSP
ncbi:Hypothetical protein EPM1_3521 [Stenotrophomonas maltophilia EPM1]|nr:Hypothetical protein EPM1_3521 [Stenotrophomonas maltophilia EPM1]